MDYYNDYLYHYGVKGMKWGVRRNRDAFSVKAAGYRALAKASEINENYYNKRGNKLYSSMQRSAKNDSLRRAEQAQAVANARRDAKAFNKQVKQVSKGTHDQQKQYGKLEDSYVYDKGKVTEKDMLKAYGRIDDSLTYRKNSNKKANEYAEKALMEIDRQLYQTGGKPTYDAKKVNDFIDKAMAAIDEDLKQYQRK